MSIKSQSENHRPPKLGQVIAITVDGTSRSYNWGQLAVGGLPAIAADASLPGEFFITLRATAACFFAFGPAAGVTIDETAADAAGAAPTLRANAPWALAAGETVRYRVSRVEHRYLYLKGTAGILRFTISSPVDP